jgi:hypothetical protein
VVGCIQKDAAYSVFLGGIAVPDLPENHETLTFLVRLWRETDAGGHDHWRGRVEHVASQQVGYVEEVAGVVDWIEKWTGQGEAIHPGRSKQRRGT